MKSDGQNQTARLETAEMKRFVLFLEYTGGNNIAVVNKNYELQLTHNASAVYRKGVRLRRRRH